MNDRMVYMLEQGGFSNRVRLRDVPDDTFVYDPVYNCVIDVGGVKCVTNEDGLYAEMAKALEWHGDQTYGDRPYSVHLHTVWSWARDLNLDLHQQRLAIFHDVLEDCDVSKEEFEALYGSDLAEDVWACSGEGVTRAEKQGAIKQKLLRRPSAINIKMLDRCGNMHASKGNSKKGTMYLREVSDWDVLLEHPQADPRIVNMFRTIAQELRTSLETAASNRTEAPGV